jgi:cytochrome c oxidase subunit 2
MPLGVRRTVFVTLLTSVVALSAASVALAGNGGFLPGNPHSPNAHRITSAFIFISIFTGVVFVLVEGALIAFIIKYRRGKRSRTAEGPQIHGATRLEVLWTVVPVMILVAIGGFVFYELPGIHNPPAASAANQTTIQIEGHQFYWLFRYPNGAISINKMIAPANELVNEDVIGLKTEVNHSWWVPDLGGKYDSIPGITNHTWFKAPVGQYAARCAELCGIQHALMDATVDVVPRAQYEAFIAQRATPADALALGEEEWKGVCEGCHRLANKYIGPPLGGNPLLADRKGIETLLRNGQGLMPAVGSDWTGAQLDALIAYTKQFTKVAS